ncbi:MAG TPA: redoxin domain-containing protein [Fimbriimonas sp.]|nr:redoxin domain-containing protein [Fimbriimonas sp.]
MRLIWIGLPAGLALASAGGLLYYLGMQPKVQTVDVLSGQPRHPVTAEMTQATGSKSAKVAPAFKAQDIHGKSVVIGSPSADRPQFVYFVLDGCPCSIEAEPLFHDLAKQFQGKVDFVSVTNADLAKAKRWDVQMLPSYPVISDPRLEIIRSFGAKNSVYSALIGKDGKIVKMWPGYSVGILTEMNKLMAKEAWVTEKPFDTKYAPLEQSSGCTFDLG